MKEKTKNEKIYFCIRLYAIIISVLILIFFSNFRFGMTVFYEDIMNKLINTSICCLIFILYIFEKNRMRIIYKILDVPDRLSLISEYSGYIIKK